MVIRVIYDQQFNSNELRSINWLRTLDDKRQKIAWLAGIVTVVLIFVTQIPFHGVVIVHILATYGCLPGGIGIGIFTYVKLDSYIEQTFSKEWDPLFFERSGHGPDWWNACDERNWLLDQPWFYGLSMEEQRNRLKEIDRNMAYEDSWVRP